MDEIVWNDSLLINNETINEQHKKLVSIINSVFRMEREDPERLSEILSELTDYTFYHFSYEEGLMKDENYPLLKNHIEEHNVFTGYVANLCIKVLEGGEISINEMKMFLKDWLIKHILENDLKAFKSS